MTKRARRNRPTIEVVSSDPEVHPDATMGPDASLDTTGMTWRDRESTSAPVVGEDEAPASYARNYPELVEKFLHNRVPLSGRTAAILIVLGWFAFISWLFLQDNQAGSLATTDGLKWFRVKAGLYSAIVAACGVVMALVLYLGRPPKAV
jgi:hypothetical protein